MSRLIAVCLSLLLLGFGIADPAWAQKKKVDQLLKDLESKDPQTRIAACNGISNLVDIRLAYAQMALPALRAILAKDPNARVRQVALGVLGRTEAEPKDYVVNMIKYLKEDKDIGVQDHCPGLAGQLRPGCGGRHFASPGTVGRAA